MPVFTFRKSPLVPITQPDDTGPPAQGTKSKLPTTLSPVPPGLLPCCGPVTLPHQLFSASMVSVPAYVTPVTLPVMLLQPSRWLVEMVPAACVELKNTPAPVFTRHCP